MEESKMDYEKSCGGVIYKEQNEEKYFLVVHMQMGHWTFPKGHVEPNETEEETAVREIKEETNIDVELLSGFRKTTEYSPRPNAIKEVVYFIGRPVSEEISCQMSEVQEARWETLEKAKELLTYQSDKSILCLANHYLQLV